MNPHPYSWNRLLNSRQFSFLHTFSHSLYRSNIPNPETNNFNSDVNEQPPDVQYSQSHPIDPALPVNYLIRLILFTFEFSHDHFHDLDTFVPAPDGTFPSHLQHF